MTKASAIPLDSVVWTGVKHGIKPKVKDPMIAVQTNDGVWRAEDKWPPADSNGYTSELRLVAFDSTHKP